MKDSSRDVPFQTFVLQQLQVKESVVRHKGSCKLTTEEAEQMARMVLMVVVDKAKMAAVLQK